MPGLSPQGGDHDVPELLEIRRGAYRDSVSLMQISRAVSAEAGVETALVAMATPLNVELLAGMGFTPPADATPNDMVVAVRGTDDAAVDRALRRLAASLAEPATAASPGFGEQPPPRTVGSAARRIHANLALISTPGQHAFADAMDALEAGLSVMVFSDNVPIEQEVRLKEEAGARGLLVMGPDCGTAVVSGLGLGFANAVRPGPVGLVAASGTGAQQVMCLLDAADVGVSHCLGVGGRDLSAAIGGRSTLQALDALDADPATELIVVVSKPPAPEVAARVRAHVATLTTPVHLALLGADGHDLTETAERALRTLGRTPPAWPRWSPAHPPVPRPGALRGLFSGGTLCDEAMLIAARELGVVRSNIPLRPDWALGDGLQSPGHLMIDFGDDRLTAGRAHPMIDSTLRLDRLAAEARDPACAVLLLDVVLGHAAHPDPATELAPAVAEARTNTAGETAVVVSLVGVAADPQGLARQALALRDAGAAVFASNADAARHAVALIRAAAR
jgi:FdrA protein